MLKNIILTIDNLSKRGWQLTSICYRCFQEEESVKHLFQECKIIKDIRGYLHNITLAHKQPCDQYKQGNIWLAADTEKNMHWRRLEVVTCFVTWREM
jgi:zinc-binding in reverse transcriptase